MFKILASVALVLAAASAQADSWAAPWNALPPDAIADEFGTLDADVSRIDDHPVFPDGQKITGFADGSFIRVTFPTPEEAPGGAKDQKFILRVNSSFGGDETAPSVTGELYEDGVPLRELGTVAVPYEAGQLVVFSWPASDLSEADGSEVELLLVFGHQVGLVVPLLDAVAWEVSH